MIPIHEAMRKAREAKGLTRYGLACRSGLNKRVIAKYELGERIPGCLNLIVLADALGISISEYVGHEVKKEDD